MTGKHALGMAALLAGTAFLGAFVGLTGMVTYSAAEDLRHLTYDHGDVATSWLIALALLQPFVIGAGLLIALGLPVLGAGPGSLRVAGVAEAMVGSIAAVCLMLVVTIPLGIIALATSGLLRRRITAEPRLRTLSREDLVDQMTIRYVPYFVTAPVMGLLVWLGMEEAVNGGACLSQTASFMQGCEQDGSLAATTVKILVLGGIGAVLVNLVFRLRKSGPKPGMYVAGATGLFFVATAALSHVLA